MNLPPIGEETFLICMMLAIAIGTLLGFALGYTIKEKKHAREITEAIRITKRIHEGPTERAPKGPKYASVRTADGREFKARLPLRSC